MASSSSFINISSIYSTPLHQLPRSVTKFPPLSHPFSSEIKPHFTSFNASSFFRLSKHGGCGCSSYVSSAMSTPNSSIFSEEGFRGFGEDSLNVSESEYENEDDVGSTSGDEHEIIKLGLPKKLVESLAQRGITKLFPIQRAVLMPALEGRDLIARAKTGTGKTLAFGIPVIKRLTEDDHERMPQRRSGRLPRALVLAPTRELALQVENEIKESAPSLSSVCIYGGVSYGIQQNALSDGVDVVVGTPGRILDLIKSNRLKLEEIQFLVLDEADQMLAVGFEEDVEMILEKIPAERQTMLFSATIPLWVKKLSKKYLTSPLTIDLVRDQDEKLPEGIKLYALPTTPSSKRRILSDLVTVYGKGDKAIIFTETKRDADEVSMSLTNSITSETLHGDISQPQRERTLNGFRKGKFTVLVATDVASRGLDIPNVDLVIHYELPNDAETFVHRSGRTGRAGKEGSVILMFNTNEKRPVRLLERDVGCKFEFIDPPAVKEVLESSADRFIGTLSGVHPMSVEFFTPIAQKLIDEHGTSAFAAALAQLSGFSRPPSSRSLISYEQGKVTLQLTLDPASVGGVFSAGSVVKLLSSVYLPAADEIEKVHIIADATIQGAVFDLPEDVAEELLNKNIPAGNTISKITKLPDLQDDWAVNSNYGRFSNRDRSMRGENSKDHRSYSASRGQGGGRFSKHGDRRQDGGWGGSRGGNWGGSRVVNNNSSSPNSTSSELDWLITDKRSGSRSSGNSNRSLNGACFTCGRYGHKSAECPTKRSY